MRMLRAWCAGLIGLSVVGCAVTPHRMPVIRDREAAERYNGLGLECIQRQAYLESETEFQRAIEADPFFGPAYCNLGLVQLELDKPFVAAWNLRHASQLMPRASQPRANLGLLFERVGKYDSAEASLRDALRESPDDIEVIGHLARVQIRQNKFTPETHQWLQTIAERDDDAVWRDWARGELIRFKRHNLEERDTGHTDPGGGS